MWLELLCLVLGAVVLAGCAGVAAVLFAACLVVAYRAGRPDPVTEADEDDDPAPQSAIGFHAIGDECCDD
jgi:hypothetical protein